ncbi:NmrA/HSCARG family protein [Pleurocapsales cyanobacterium LEGE 06147]|nr:NmrA/HSCARG family protein [Pleurocapsales cyanobacterium LEGE 06147]
MMYEKVTMLKPGSTILVIGATGAMGKSVIKALLRDETSSRWKIRAFTRNSKSSHAKQLENLSPRIELTEGNNDDAKSIETALIGVDGVFCNTDFWTCGSQAIETEQGLRILELSRVANVKHFIYSSLDDCYRISSGKLPVPHFDAKAAVEAHIDRQRDEGEPWYTGHTTVLRTAPYFENFQSYFLPQPERDETGQTVLTFSIPMADKKWTMVALDDIGWFVVHIFANPATTIGKTLAIASDSLTIKEIASLFTEVTGISAIYNEISLNDFRSSGEPGAEEGANLFQFVQECGLERDFEELRLIHPGLLSFKSWLEKSGWQGESVSVQKLLADLGVTAKR